MIGNFRPSQTKTHDLSNTLKSLRAFRTVPSRRVAAAPTKNSENNPMQSSRTAAATDGLDRHGLDRNLDTSGK
jgi:hypothetical protein